MPVGAKILITVVIGAAGVLILVLDVKAGRDRAWRWGRFDPLRLLLFRCDGTMRRGARWGLLVFFAAVLAVVWLLG